ncbi:L-dopachrome tautomerase-related protein [Pelotalea chapellei]|uniref:Major royal jelly protein n=1 Tax=Pelotalea chapellei TaxID=44671 RepID=A0ABS5U3W4_9BACT|nr:L-dopachrome tautomerase-related protein [Pelotalea chapellei]MBT1070344.1 hypothetical protein [Pelotalea chapellei]
MAVKTTILGLRLVLSILAFCVLSGCYTPPPSNGVSLPTVRDFLLVHASFKDQPTGIAVSSQARLFVSFPQWGKRPLHSVVEVLPDGSLRPYPDLAWNSAGNQVDSQSGKHFICVQSVFVDDRDNLWILDPASPSFKGVVKGGAKLIKVNLAGDRVEQVIHFDTPIIRPESYLNDVRIDTIRQLAYISDSGTGAIIVTDLSDGTSRRILDGHPSTRAEAGYVPVIDGRNLLGENGQPPQIHADGIALSPDNNYLYYHALTARSLYRIETVYLRDPIHTPEEVSRKVEKVAETGLVDGMLIAENGDLYLTLPEEKAIKRLGKDGRLATIVKDERLQWPDSMSISPGNLLYFTDSQINKMPRFNEGNDRRILPYKLYKVLLPLL